MISYTRLHRRGYSEGLMNPGEVVIHEVEGYSMIKKFGRASV